MNAQERSEIRELTATELEQVTGGLLVCANGAHFKEASVSTRSRTPVGSFGGILIY
jgi:bacteriocin-like protein